MMIKVTIERWGHLHRLSLPVVLARDFLVAWESGKPCEESCGLWSQPHCVPNPASLMKSYVNLVKILSPSVPRLCCDSTNFIDGRIKQDHLYQ